MKVLIIYDSAYGNTARLAQTMAQAVKPPHDVAVTHMCHVSAAALHRADLIIFGSPTQGGRPTQYMQQMLDRLSSGSLAHACVAAFDTRYAFHGHGPVLGLLMHAIGFAAPRLATSLQSKGGLLVGRPEGFIVESKNGPLRSGELERATAWFRSVLAEAGYMHNHEAFQPLEYEYATGRDPL